MNDFEHAKKKRQILKEFIKLYESFPCLWQIKSKEYHDRELRTRAYKILVQKLQQLQPGADRAAVVKKINCLRSNLRKEKRKTLEYLKAGRVYRTQLWYYNLFNFLNDIGRPKTEPGEEDTTNMKTDDDPLKWQTAVEEDPQSTIEISHNDEDESCEAPRYEIETLHFSHDSNHENNGHEANTSDYDIEARKLKRRHQEDEVRETVYRLKEHEDRHDVFGKNVAMKLRHISSISDTQRLIAEKVINDALCMAEMGLLTMDHCKVLN